MTSCRRGRTHRRSSARSGTERTREPPILGSSPRSSAVPRTSGWTSATRRSRRMSPAAGVEDRWTVLARHGAMVPPGRSRASGPGSGVGRKQRRPSGWAVARTRGRSRSLQMVTRFACAISPAAGRLVSTPAVHGPPGQGTRPVRTVRVRKHMQTFKPSIKIPRSPRICAGRDAGPSRFRAVIDREFTDNQGGRHGWGMTAAPRNGRRRALRRSSSAVPSRTRPALLPAGPGPHPLRDCSCRSRLAILQSA